MVDREPQPGDGPEYHADHAYWVTRQKERGAQQPKPEDIVYHTIDGATITTSDTYPRLESDPVNSPSHYTSHPSGVECITISEWFSSNLGQTIQYIWRANDKGQTIEDLKKARWFLDREISRLTKMEK